MAIRQQIFEIPPAMAIAKDSYTLNRFYSYYIILIMFFLNILELKGKNDKKNLAFLPSLAHLPRGFHFQEFRGRRHPNNVSASILDTRHGNYGPGTFRVRVLENKIYHFLPFITIFSSL